MCGVCGIVSFEAGGAPSRPEVQRMIVSLAHRGPDDSGIEEGAGFALGFTRLAIPRRSDRPRS